MKSIIINTIFIVLLTYSCGFSQIASADTLIESSVDTIFIMKKSPWGATLRSAVIPGWGQFYNESYLKIPIVWGISGWMLYNYFDNDKNYKLYRDLYLTNIDNRYKNNREFYKDQRDLFAIYFFLAYVANLVDAYVDAHLFDFSVTEDFLLKSPRINLRMYF